MHPCSSTLPSTGMVPVTDIILRALVNGTWPLRSKPRTWSTVPASLWAATGKGLGGIARPATGRRPAPAARRWPDSSTEHQPRLGCHVPFQWPAVVQHFAVGA